MAGLPTLLITANVGSIFEEPQVMLKLWTEEFLSTVSRLDPKFIALHCQEVGGKNYEHSMQHVEDFVRLLMSSEELRLFDKVSVFLDEDFSSAEHFTALGNFYFIHESIKDALLFDFEACKFYPLDGKQVHSGNIEAVTTKEKAKFPQDFFPECKWSRKGFLRTRWSINGTVFDLINIHLFHDASNFIAMEESPSVYSKTRRRALEHTLDRFHTDQYPNVPYFLFGDFNFRTDTSAVIKILTEDTQENQLLSKGSISKLQFRNKDDKLVLTLGKKEFSHHDHKSVFVENGGQWLREHDRELENFDGRLYEFPIKFLPSYPFEEDVEKGSYYMETRVPAWCDRILLNLTAKSLIRDITSPDAVEYGVIAPNTCMGDHKPVYLRIVIASDAGMINCCTSCPELCFRVPEYYLDLLSLLPDCRSNLNINNDNHNKVYPNNSRIDREKYPSTKLLHALPIEHDPYTPDSMDSPSPSAFVISTEPELQECEHKNNNNNNNQNLINKTLSMQRNKRLDMAVSPTLLKSKLELIVQNKEKEKAKRQKQRKKHDLVDYRLNSWPETYQSRNIHYLNRDNRCNSDITWLKSWRLSKHNLNKLSNSSSSSSNSAIDELNACNLVIPRIAIINASNFQSNESSMDLQDERFITSLRRLSSGNKDGTSGEGSSLELDTSEERHESDDNKDTDKICSRTQDSGVDTLDVEDTFSHGGSIGISSNEISAAFQDESEIKIERVQLEDGRKNEEDDDESISECAEVVDIIEDDEFDIDDTSQLNVRERQKSEAENLIDDLSVERTDIAADTQRVVYKDKLISKRKRCKNCCIIS